MKILIKGLVMRKIVRNALWVAVLCAGASGSARADFIVGAGATVTVTNNAVLDSSGGVTVNGVLDASGSPSGRIRLTGEWSAGASSVFVYGGSTVSFYNVMTATVTGNSTFYVLASTEPGKTIKFQFGSTQTIVNALNLGQTSLGNEVKLRSTQDGQRWSFSVLNGPRKVNYLDVRDANATGSSVTACVSVDSGNNYNWFFPGDLSVLMSFNSYDFGNVALGASTQTVAGVTVTNNGCGPQTLQLSASTGTAGTSWRVGVDTITAPTNDTFLLRGVFHNVQPSTAPTNQFASEDVINATGQSSTASKYSVDGTETGTAVNVGDQRHLWFFLEMPLTTSTTWQQQINAVVTATP